MFLCLFERPFETMRLLPLAMFFLCGVAASQFPQPFSMSREGGIQPFPMRVTARAPGQVSIAPVPEAIERLVAFDRVVFDRVPSPEGGALTLVLRRVPLGLAPGAVSVDGVRFDGPADPSLSLWSGRILGMPGSEAFLSFSRHGCRGWFGVPGRLLHLLPEVGPRGDWSRATARIVTEDLVAASGGRPELTCRTLDPHQTSSPARRTPGSAAPAGMSLYDAPIAFETDYEFYALFNDLKAAQNYAFSLIGAVSDRYRAQVDVIFTLPYVGFHTKNNDPWTSTSCTGRLTQFRTTWAGGRAPARAQLYHMISGVRVSGCGGVAYLSTLCNQNFGFAMSAHINKRLTFPPVQGPLTWDFFVVAHELGHNFGSRHTHDYRPPIDQCNQRKCGVTPNGTIMSYCHLCPGGMRNINLKFHPRVATVIRNFVVRSCLKLFDGVITRDEGYALAGSGGVPDQKVSFVKPDVKVAIQKAPASQPGALIVGATKAMQPVLGVGILVPSLDAYLLVSADAKGAASVSIPVHASFPAGITVWMHSWFVDPKGPKGYAATNATRVELIRP